MHKGVPPSGSGHSAEPEPISVVSAETASVPNAMDLLAAELKAVDLSTRFISGGYGWKFASAAIRAINTMRRLAVEAAADDCKRIALTAAHGLELGPCDPIGWPETPDGAAYHQSRAIASLIEESLEHETLRELARARGDHA